MPPSRADVAYVHGSLLAQGRSLERKDGEYTAFAYEYVSLVIDSGGVPPVSIPNTEVKPSCADGTAFGGRVGRRQAFFYFVNMTNEGLATTLAGSSGSPDEPGSQAGKASMAACRETSSPGFFLFCEHD